MQSRRRRRYVKGLIIACCIGTAFCIAFWFNFLSGLQMRGSDFLFRSAGAQENAGTEARIVIAAIDDRSLDELGRLTAWPRSYHATVVDALARAEARTIVFDVLFAEPAAGDEELAEAMKRAGNVVLPVAYTGAQEAPGVVRPLPIFEENAAALGHANMLPDADGVVRRLPLAWSDGDAYEPALALAAVAEYLRRPQAIESPIENSQLHFAGRSIPLDSSHAMIVNYPGGLQTVSYLDVLRGEVDPALFEDRIVIIGATAAGLGDMLWTPAGQMMHGVEIHASAMNTILSGDFLKPVHPGVTSGLILLPALLCAPLVLRLRVLWAAPSVLLLCMFYLFAAFFCFDRGTMLNMVYPPMALLGAFGGVNLYSIASERSEKREIAKTFGRYVSSPVAEKILAALDEGEPVLEGCEQEITVAFADVRGFTGLSEKMPPEELLRILNTHFSAIITEFEKNRGTINKFGGDSVMAIWNAPVRCEDHALLAVIAAVDARRALRELREKDPSLPRVDFSIGINTGKAMAGNVGSEERLEYSVVGDVVNTAARLTSLAGGGEIWIGADTYFRVKDHCATTPLGMLDVKGKRKPVSAYEVTDIRRSVLVGC
ncbi:MAG: adenylate/guanylate cyclase domain-containing protein [Dehalococcoidia bacterium]|nr:adenylate/guanylate cyclase domain-containing protein [Dehalococcoidia bacterium]